MVIVLFKVVTRDDDIGDEGQYDDYGDEDLHDSDTEKDDDDGYNLKRR
jgi:hypothetical protein